MSSRKSTVDWDNDIYKKGLQINHWPYTEVISAVLNATKGMDRSQQRFLEIGCGAGNNLWFALASGFQVAGLDMSPTAIYYARDRLATQGFSSVDLRVGDLKDLSWNDETFDIVLDRGALTQNTHLDVALAANEVWRVLKPGGSFLSFTLFGMNDPGREFGKEVSPGAYDHFEGGYFAQVGLTSFFDPCSLRNVFRPFGEITIERFVSENEMGEVTSEHYAVVCKK